MKLLARLAEAGDERSVSALAAELGIPRSSAYRVAATFERFGMLTRVRRGYYLPGLSLFRLAQIVSLNKVLRGVGRPIVEKLARETGCIAHLGVFEAGMVTYLLKAGRAAGDVFTREGTQLEAYCTGIGKVLLAALPESTLEEYLASGPFIRLTPNTLTDPRSLRAALAAVAAQGYATDDAEMDSDLRCVAVPLRAGDGDALGALSISMRQANGKADRLLVHLTVLRTAASTLGERLKPGGFGGGVR